MKVLRIYHEGRDAVHRERDRALSRAGADVTLVVPTSWTGSDDLGEEPFEVVQLPVVRGGDVNRHRFADPAAVARLVASRRPEVLDLHEEPFSSVVHQVLRRLPHAQPVVSYAAQNIDKRFPPPFAQWERHALARIQGIYPCTRQAASVVVGKGFSGPVSVLPLAPPTVFTTGDQRPPTNVIRMLLVGRLVPEKGVQDAVRTLAAVRRRSSATLSLVGTGSEAEPAISLARELGVLDALELHSWLAPARLADVYRQAHILLAPSRSTRTWTEQFGRMVVEAQAAGVVVVGYASGSLPEVVGDAGVLVREGDDAALAHEVLRLQDRPDRWNELRDEGRAMAARGTWDRVAAGQLDLYDQSVRGTPRPGPLRPRRAVAASSFGPPATPSGGGRPFALPLLRADTAATRAFARLIDLAGRHQPVVPPARLRVVYVDHVARLSGGELALSRLLEALPQVEAHVILGEDGPLRATLERGGATVEILPLNASTRDVRRGELGTGLAGLRHAAVMIPYVFRLTRRLRVLRPDLVHTNSLKSGYYGSVAARLAGTPVVWHLRDRLAEDYLPRPAVWFTRLLLRHVPSMVVCNSAATMRAASGDRRAEAGRIRVVHDPYQPVGTAGGTSHGVLIGMIGRIAPWKGQDLFLRAFADGCADLPDVHARIIGSALFGEDDYALSLLTLVRDLGIGTRVSFAGFSDNVEAELADLDVLVHASVVPEPFGQVIVEGMAAGLPVIAAAAGGPLEIITDEVNGLLVTPGDVAELTAALRRLVCDSELRARLGRTAVIRARDFESQVIGERMLALYRSVLAS